jgi:hypothetical protein
VVAHTSETRLTGSGPPTAIGPDGRTALTAMLEARSVALVGASPRDGSLGQRMITEMARSNPAPRTYPAGARGQRWQLVAWNQGHQLSLDLESPSGHSYSGQDGFAASHDYRYYWGEGLGPGNSTFYYGPVPGSAVMVRLTAPGHRPLLVRTAPLPAGHGLPAGRFFIVQPPGGVSLSWTVTPLDAAGHQVAFRDF